MRPEPVPLRLCIDASNLRSGGTVTHLVELLRAADPSAHGFAEVIVCAGSAVLGKIEDRSWLRKVADPLLEQAANPFHDRRHLLRAFWQRFRLRRFAEAAHCDLLFVPGGMDNSGFHPFVTMSRNMLPFDLHEARRYGLSAARVRLLLLRRLQTRTFRRADGMIFLTNYAREVVSSAVGNFKVPPAVIPHGVSVKFSEAPRRQRSLDECTPAAPFRLLYVSTIDVYKHQRNVVDAVAGLRASGMPLFIDFVGMANGRALRQFAAALAHVDPAGDFSRYRGAVPYDELHHLYKGADLKVFASSCENMPNILVEAMAAGLPVACSSRGPMKEVLGDAGEYFDPEQPAQIALAIRRLIVSPELRLQKATQAFERARHYSWEHCARETFTYLAACAAKRRMLDA